MWIRTCDMMSLYPINDPERDFSLDTYYDCRCTVGGTIYLGELLKDILLNNTNIA